MSYYNICKDNALDDAAAVAFNAKIHKFESYRHHHRATTPTNTHVNNNNYTKCYVAM